MLFSCELMLSYSVEDEVGVLGLLIIFVASSVSLLLENNINKKNGVCLSFGCLKLAGSN